MPTPMSTNEICETLAQHLVEELARLGPLTADEGWDALTPNEQMAFTAYVTNLISRYNQLQTQTTT